VNAAAMKNPRLFVDVIRHGEPVGGARYRGHGIDDPLSEKGWGQMREAVAGTVVWDAVYSSPLRRCREFAEAVADERRLPLTIVDDFREVGFGGWEGCTKAELIELDASAFERFYQDPVNQRPPGAEPLGNFLHRVQSAWQRLVAEETQGHVLVVGHAGVIRAILAGILDLDPAAMYRVVVKNGGVMRIGYRSGTPNLEWLNGHL
jgi:broad specificity phosphatase PhoE